jgi:hypothetical protein
VKRPAFIFVVAAVAATCVAQSPDSRSAAAVHAFDFWIGDWNIQQKILQEDGSWLTFEAETSVTQTLDGLALVEHWKGKVQFFWEGMQQPEFIEGLSVRAYDPKTRKWYIHWMDTRRPYFGPGYSGGFKNGRGEFFREWESPQGKQMGRITFSKISSNSVDWALAISKDEGKNWSTLWTMHMDRRSKQSSRGEMAAPVQNDKSRR